MKRTSLILAIGLLIVLGVLFTNQPAPTQPALGKKYVKWEYKIVDVLDMLPQDLDVADLQELNKSVLKNLNKFGDEGWELTAFANQAVFKRPK